MVGKTPDLLDSKPILITALWPLASTAIKQLHTVGAEVSLWLLLSLFSFWLLLTELKRGFADTTTEQTMLRNICENLPLQY